MSKLKKTLVATAVAAAVAVPVAQADAMKPSPWLSTGVARPALFKDASGLRHILRTNHGIARMNPTKTDRILL
jgi:hypothetical protein